MSPTGGKHFKLHMFVPRPKCCVKCQDIGHLENGCRGLLKCCCCCQVHRFDECGKVQSPKCVNCSGAHSAAFRGCPKYL